ncbi:subtilisin-like protease SBT4.3 [Rosa sericea]
MKTERSILCTWGHFHIRSTLHFLITMVCYRLLSIADMKEVVSVFPSTALQLQTRRSWDFMGFTEKIDRRGNVESDIIVDVIDSGIWPESESSNDEVFGPPPKKWKGACMGGFNFTCNNLSLLCKANDEDRKVHIVYLGSLPNMVYSPSSHHLGILQKVVQGSGSLETYLIRSYKRSFNGFAAKLTDQEREKLANMKEVVSIFQSTKFKLQTTRSWDFMGFNESINRNATIESDVIIGVIDSGIWPESGSFQDKGFGPAPKKWKGACNGGKNFTCNNKLIGARYYSSVQSARDEVGHGSHTASTAAGNVVKDVSFYGLAQGTARGGVPSARIAAYQVCDLDSFCSGHDVLAAFDDAIADGVDIITLSIGTVLRSEFYKDPIAIGSFHAMAKGILTSNSAGNEGPAGDTVSSAAPWTLTVAASSIDRRIIGKVVLGNGSILVGTSVNTFTLNGSSFPLIYGKDASSHECSDSQAGLCDEDCLDSDSVEGKIVLCDAFDEADFVVHKAGALGSILNNDGTGDFSNVVSLPAIALSYENYNAVKFYMNSTRDPRATILRSEVINDPAAPIVASFSSRGPNPITPDIIKPDITAPGVDILAAYSPVASISESPEDKRHVKYHILSGTSVSCPHAAAVAAFVKSFHPDWSPSAIKSSLMTTAWPMNNTNNAPAEFAYGSGHINPVKAIDPGLVYETSKEDFINLLCMDYDEAKVRLISGDNSTCPTGSDKGSPKDLNYPSMAAANITPKKPFTINFHRTVKNVGLANSTYNATIFQSSKDVDIKVVPEFLSFKSLNEERSFDVTVVGKGLIGGSLISSSLVWSDGIHNVRSPVVVRTEIA